jgi:GNAT superfamily N-acetyltransferase
LQAPVAAFSITPLTEGDLPTVLSLTFPSYRPLLEKVTAAEQTKEQIIAFVARSAGGPVGLVMASYSLVERDLPADKKTSPLNVLSIMTTPLWRHCGVASALMKALAEEARLLGRTSMTLRYTTKIESLLAFEHLLLSAGWCAPQPSMQLSLFKLCDMASAPWLSMVTAPPLEYELFALSELRDQERTGIMGGIATGDISEGLSPFADEELLVPELSFGLRKGSDVVAWMTLIRSPFVPDALCYRSLFVNPRLRMANGFGPFLAAHAFQRHLASSILEERPKGLFGTSYTATKQLNFVRKRVSPHCCDLYETRTATLPLLHE